MEFLKTLLLAVVTAAVPVLTGGLLVFIRRMGENAAANTENITAKTYIEEITEAICAAVAATNQTYVDSLKNSGDFNRAAQQQAAQKSLEACMASISPAAKEFIERAYGDVTAYLTTKIEAEVRKQKNAALMLSPVMELTGTQESTK